jgi:hypothetical protein
MTIGNIHSRVRNKPTNNAWIPIAFLPIPPKQLTQIPGYSSHQQGLDAQQIFHQLISYLIRPLSDPGVADDGIEMTCGDETIRRCFPRLNAWLADHVENATIHCNSQKVCPTCIAPKSELGVYTPTPHPRRTHTGYMEAWYSWKTTGDKSDVKILEEDDMRPVNNALWHIPHLDPPDLVRADILHTIYLGLLKHLMIWIQGFLDDMGRLRVFDELWMHIPPYPGYTQPNKAYRTVSMWSGKELRNLGRVILAVFTATMYKTSDVSPLTNKQKGLRKDAIRCVQYLSDYALMTQYPTQSETNIKIMEDYLSYFHQTKHIFKPYRAYQSDKLQAKVAKEEALAIARQIASDQLTLQPKPLTVTQKRKLEAQQTKEAQLVADEILAESAHYNFPKLHLVTHYADQIRQYGSLPQYSTEPCETSHKALKDAYRHSNHVDATPQIIRTYTRQYKFASFENNLRVWSAELPHVQAIIDNVSQPTRTAPNDSTRVYKLQGRQKGGKPCTLSDLLDEYNLPDLAELTLSFFQRNELPGFSFDSDEQWLLRCPVEYFNTLRVPVPSWDRQGYVMHHVRSTGNALFRKSDARADWVWVRRKPVKSDKAKPGSLNGKIPGKLNALFKLRYAGQTIRMAHISLTRSVSGPTPNGDEGMLKVKTYSGNNVVVRITDIEGMAHLIPIDPELWLVNNRNELLAWEDMNDGF